jgi:hypothetical protein
VNLKRTLAAIFLFVTSMGAQAEPSQYLCVVEQSAGLHYDRQTKSWAPQAFSTGRKYVLRRVNDDVRQQWADYFRSRPKANWIFLELGDHSPTALCEDMSGCLAFTGGRVDFDQNSLRFELSNSGSYVSQGIWEQHRSEHPDDYNKPLRLRPPDPDNPDDLYFAIGRCSPF